MRCHADALPLYELISTRLAIQKRSRGARRFWRAHNVCWRGYVF